jgi:hypothetical protein
LSIVADEHTRFKERGRPESGTRPRQRTEVIRYTFEKRSARNSLVRINGQELKTFVVRVADHGEVSKTAVPSNDGFPLCLLLMRNTSR